MVKVLFSVTATICRHPDGGRHVTESGFLRCEFCGSQFPNTKDTSLWAEGIKIEIERADEESQ